MAFKRPRQRTIREVSVTVPHDGGEREHVGANLDDVLRQIIWDMAERSGWSGNQAARRLGVKQPTLQTFLDAEIDDLPPDRVVDRTMRMETLSRICAALKCSPVDLFRQHERYKPETRDEAKFAEDLIFDRFRALLTPSAARRLVRLIEVWNDRDALASQLDAWERASGVVIPSEAKAPNRKEIKEKRPT